MKLLVVDDEQDLQEILKYNLEIEGYEVDTASSAEEALDKDLSSYDLFLLDVMMDGMSGFQMAMRLKAMPEVADTPIIFITALDSENEKVRGLNIGADDYITKPLGMQEVKARVKAVLRRTVKQKQQMMKEEEKADDAPRLLVFETLSLNTASKVVTMDDEVLPLTKLEFSLLMLFLETPGRLFSREELLTRCWPEEVYVLGRTVDVSINRLRKKIGGYGQHIKTRIGYGYVFE
ncbi:MAG: response regulator transcription factor [Bacteroidaceae bacterium]|nr:response regulator transcription factor [Bacteroidaceae bacterium]MBQ5839719.1 response regulator transcription factor [Bacteroidaceae bacterium]MBQ5912081.1 response regulator transcription factor [Bacteroidaceae bacterium]